MSGLFGCGSFLRGLFRRRSPFIDSKVAGPQVLRSEWAEIDVDKPLKPIGDHQEIGLYLTKPCPLDPWKPRGILMPDGSYVLPEVETVTSEGLAVKWEYSGQRGELSLTYRLIDESIKHEYVRIRVRADQEIPLEAIYWTGFIIKNMP